MISDEEAGWHAEADQIFGELIAVASADPSYRLTRAGRDLERDAADWLVSIALNCDDREYVEGHCIRLAKELPPGHPMLGLAGLCLGHTARRFRRLSTAARTTASGLGTRCRANPDDVDTRALNGLEDIDHYAPATRRAG